MSEFAWPPFAPFSDMPRWHWTVSPCSIFLKTGVGHCPWMRRNALMLLQQMRQWNLTSVVLVALFVLVAFVVFVAFEGHRQTNHEPLYNFAREVIKLIMERYNVALLEVPCRHCDTCSNGHASTLPPAYPHHPGPEPHLLLGVWVRWIGRGRI